MQPDKIRNDIINAQMKADRSSDCFTKTLQSEFRMNWSRGRW